MRERRIDDADRIMFAETCQTKEPGMQTARRGENPWKNVTTRRRQRQPANGGKLELSNRFAALWNEGEKQAEDGWQGIKKGKPVPAEERESQWRQPRTRAKGRMRMMYRGL